MSNSNSTLTADEAKILFAYDTDSGKLVWAFSKGRAKAGNEAGTVHSDGYRNVGVNGIIYPCHRIAWLIVNGDWPKYQIDHINGSKTDNRIINLRDVNQSANIHNIKKASARSLTGVRGVSWSERLRRYYAQIQINGKSVYLGIFSDLDAANSAYLKAKSSLPDSLPNTRGRESRGCPMPLPLQTIDQRTPERTRCVWKQSR